MTYKNNIISFLLIGLGIYAAYNYFQARSGERLYDNFFSMKDMGLDVQRGADEAVSSLKMSGLQALTEEQFSEAELIFQDILGSDPYDSESRYYLGLSALEQGNVVKAKECFEVVRMNEPQLFDAASWYLALTLVRSDETKAAKDILSQSQWDENDLYFTKAQDLMKEI